jgi:DNA repair protein RecO (recombination protein O)
MPLDQAEAIVLRTANIGDQDKLAVFLTRDKGLIRGVAKGARKFGNRFGSALEPMSRVTVFYYEKERRDLITVSSCDLIESSFEFQADPRVAATLAYFGELIEEFVPVRAREDVVFRLLRSVLEALKRGADRAFLTGYFEAWLLQVNGLLPDVRRCRKCRRPLEAGGWLAPKRDGVFCPDCTTLKRDETPPALAPFLDWVRKNPPARWAEFSLAPEGLKAVRRTLRAVIVYHLEREPKSLRCIKD